jgi:RNA polymerase sigma-70 factor (ECF subfamily)
MDPEEEQDCIQRSQAGDRVAFEDLVRANARLVWASVYGLLRDPAWAEDLVQETFLRAWESIGELKEPGAFRGWILTIARRLAWRHAEVQGRPLPAAAEAGPSELPADPEEVRERVREALESLPERYRLPLTLHFLNGMEYEAISRSLGMANGSLRGLIARGTKRLRGELAPWWRQAYEHS